MTLTQRQLLGLLIVVAAAVVGALLGKDNATLAAVIAGGGGLAALLFGGSGAGPSLDSVRNAIRRAGMGKQSARQRAPQRTSPRCTKSSATWSK